MRVKRCLHDTINRLYKQFEKLVEHAVVSCKRGVSSALRGPSAIDDSCFISLIKIQFTVKVAYDK